MSKKLMVKIKRLDILVFFEPILEDQLCSDTIHLSILKCLISAFRKQLFARIFGGQTFVYFMDRQLKVFVQPVGEGAGFLRDGLVGAIHVERDADDQRIRQPFLN